MTTTIDFSKKQLATILSALDDAPRSPANKGEALRAIGRSAKRFGLTADDVLAAAPGLLDDRLSPANFQAARPRRPGPERRQRPTGPHRGAGSRRRGRYTRPEPTEPPQAAQEPATPKPAAESAAQASPPAKRKAKTKAQPAKAHPPTSRRRAPARSKPR